MSVRVLIVDDQAPFRDVARTVVELTDGFEVVGEVETGEDSVTSARDLRPDLVLMDVNLPGISGLDATRQILAGVHQILEAPQALPKLSAGMQRREVLGTCQMPAYRAGMLHVDAGDGASDNPARQPAPDGDVGDAARRQAERSVAQLLFAAIVEGHVGTVVVRAAP